MNIIKEKFTCKICNKIFKEPVFLPCHNSMCKAHVDEVKKGKKEKIECMFCKEQHEIPSTGFKLNDIINDIIEKDGHLDENEKQAKANVKTKLDELFKLKNETEKLQNDVELAASEQFMNIINILELKRDELKIEIDNVADNLISQTKKCKENYVEHLKKMKNDNASIKDTPKKLEKEISNELRNPLIDNKQLSSLNKEAYSKIVLLSNRINEYKHLKSKIETCKVDKTAAKIREDVFGRLVLTTSLSRPQMNDLSNIDNAQNEQFNVNHSLETSSRIILSPISNQRNPLTKYFYKNNL